MNHLSKTLLVGGIALLALPDSTALAQDVSLSAPPQATATQASATKDSDPSQTPVAPEASSIPATPSDVPTNKAEEVSADVTQQAVPEVAERAATSTADEKAPVENVQPGKEATVSSEEEELSHIEQTFREAGVRRDLSEVDPDEVKNRVLLGEEIDSEIDRITDEAITQAMTVQGDNDAPEADQAVDQAITEAVDEALANAAAKSDQGSPYHTPGTYKNEVNHLRNLRATSGTSGETGLLRTSSAVLGTSGTVRLSLMGEAFQQSGFPQSGTELTHVGGTFAANLVFLRYFEGFFSYKVASDYVETKDTYDLSQSLGDFRFGIKGASQVFHGFYLGGAMKFTLFPGFGADWGGSDIGFNFSPQIMASWDARAVHRDVPLVLHLNLGAVFSNQDKIYDTYAPSAFDEFALSMNRYSQLTLAFGVEIPLPYVTPFVEWNMALPITAATLHDFSGREASRGDAMANRLAFGGKVTALPDVTFTVGFEVGLNNKVIQGACATPAFMFHFGLSYTFDPLMNHRDEEVPFVDLPPMAIMDTDVSSATDDASEESQDASQTGDGDDKAEAESDDKVADDASTNGSQTATDSKNETGAEDGSREGDGASDDEDEVAATAPVAQPKVVVLSEGKAVAAKLMLLDDPTQTFEMTQEGSEVNLKAGKHRVVVLQEGKLAFATTLEIPEKQADDTEPAKAIEIHVENAKARPQRSDVSMTGDEIKLTGKVSFMGQSSKLRISSLTFIDQIADVMLLGQVKKIKVEVHTDFPRQANPDTLMALSKARAESVKAALVERGVPEDRIEAIGFGGTKPIKPNGLPKGREMNRRVEFKMQH